MMRKTFVGALLAGSMTWSLAALAQGGAPAAAEPQVVLPPQPSWAPSAIPEKYPDGRWSIRGVRKNAKTTMKQAVQVKGVLVKVYECPPERKKCPKGQECKPCEVPHFYIGDTADTPIEKSMIVCNFPVKPKPPTLPPVGTELLVDGVFSEDAGGFADSRGLLNHAKTTTADGKVIATGNSVTSEEMNFEEGGKKGLPGKGKRR